MSARRTALLAAALAVWASPVFAQSSAVPPGRIDVGGGLLWIGSQPLGSSNANETTSTGGQLALFNTSTELASVLGFQAHVEVRAWRSLDVEGSGSYAKPEIRTQVTADFEGAAPITATEQLQQFTVAGSLVWNLLGDRSARVVPFVIGGGGYLRQLHERETLAVSGQFYQIGGGLKVMFNARPSSPIKAVGIRADVLAAVRVNGVAFDTAPHVSPAVALSLIARF